ncbi:hypothetical protein [Mechercharimyces sp. CAU 1602]|uniref:hypothetical protein n=1 Tax=Mechercharimyces sp. CAU 1602 TaxID=2973933 RepID=UPI00216118BE|nr:hypothetical protein [Mechercharimyces sp. CAU 1602]MCS1350195.1 hypothetical protein [Mechercharimyces sp. CAU 1602]
MNIFPHAYVVNFDAVVREMDITKFEQLVTEYLGNYTSVLVGTIDLEEQELFVLGEAKKLELDSEAGMAKLHFDMEEGARTWEEPLSSLVKSHDASFDIKEPEQGLMRVKVIYLTFDNGERESTWFFVDQDHLQNPLDYVVEFWRHVHHFGDDFDSGSCCSTNMFRPQTTASEK